MSSVKEPHFFARPEDGPYRRRIGQLDEYERLFPESVTARGESSPTYSLYPRHRDVPRRIAKLVPDARFVYLVRDPVARMISTYMHRRSAGGVTSSFEEELGDLSDPSKNRYVYPSLYAMQLDRYLEVFPRERILVVDQAELRQNRIACLAEIFGFLGVDPAFRSPLFASELGVSKERREYPDWYARTLDWRAPALVRWIPRDLRRSGRRLAERALWAEIETPVLRQELRRQLETICAADTARLRELTGQRFAAWSV